VSRSGHSYCGILHNPQRRIVMSNYFERTQNLLKTGQGQLLEDKKVLALNAIAENLAILADVLDRKLEK